MIKVLFLGTIGAIIGWITNILAIKLIFRPIKPIKIPIINLEIVGLIPKRRKEIAKSVGEVVEKELISIEEIIDKLIREEDKTSIIKFIKDKIESIVEEKLPPFIPTTFKEMIKDYIDKVVEEEIANVITKLSEDLIHKSTSRIKIGTMVEDKINEFDLEKLEEIIINIAKKELKHIEILGLILGLVIGIIQGLIVINM
ncbi:DUF445 domain-containing protein [Tepidibacter formicigenes]|jgi:uncharacterized membrane protein YheB (UPF0754 family)|uniref:DUF445 domain-containing protein n=1 Tax=Tepidibacter formicigenes DSM 15518 TaxID=1123349 RepID=A0A1M6KNY2_9FIRM|nr:DUF445 family protein [Tepidibacter formicigenes]SHJ60592.1 Protein of unknown function [Tepidibacter formicigenes DSM 15518]